MHIEPFYDEATSSLTYVVHDGASGVVIDPVWDFDPKAARTSLVGAEKVADYIDRQRLAIPYVIDTHAHADHLTALAFFARRYGAKTVTGPPVIVFVAAMIAGTWLFQRAERTSALSAPRANEPQPEPPA